jgi:predicted ArsR family transcriptional regulator
VREHEGPVTREEVARAVDISRGLAAFHLDTLLAEALLRVHFARPPGRSGPGAGRTSKMYEPSEEEVDVSLPERRYDLAGRLLVEALRTAAPEESAADATNRVARAEGRAIGEEIRRAEHLRRPGAERTMGAARDALERYGFEPRLGDDRSLSLRNCPYRTLARQSPELICGMNQAFVDGLLRGLGNETVEAALTCRPGDCCVTVRPPA